MPLQVHFNPVSCLSLKGSVVCLQVLGSTMTYRKKKSAKPSVSAEGAV